MGELPTASAVERNDRIVLPFRLTVSLVLLLWSISCFSPGPSPRVIYSNPLNSLENILTRSGVALDRTISYSGKGAIRIDTIGPTTIHLAEVQPQHAEGVVLMYRGHVRTANLGGRTYLEMSCTVAGKGDFLSGAQVDALTGTTDWVRQEAQRSLDRGQRAQTVRLNLVIEGAGIVWVNNIVLAQSSLVANKERKSAADSP